MSGRPVSNSGGTEPPVTGTKQCARCRQTLHVLAFAGDRTRTDGLAFYCRDCNSAVGHARYSRTRKLPAFYGESDRGDDSL